MTNETVNINDITVVDAEIVSEQKQAITAADLNEKLIVHVESGYVFQVMPKDAAFVYLLGGPKMMTVPIIRLLKLMSNGQWRFAGPDETIVKRPELTPEQLHHKQMVLHALMLMQLTLEAADSLKGTLDHNKYLCNVIGRAVKELERYAAKDIKNVYGTDPQLFTNVLNTMDRVVARMVEKLPHEYFFIEMVMDDYEANPKKQQERPVTLEKLNADIEE